MIIKQQSLLVSSIFLLSSCLTYTMPKQKPSSIRTPNTSDTLVVNSSGKTVTIKTSARSRIKAGVLDLADKGSIAISPKIKSFVAIYPDGTSRSYKLNPGSITQILKASTLALPSQKRKK